MANLNIPTGTMIGFSANKTEEQAKADTSSHRMNICNTKQLYIDGQRVGLSEAEQSYLAQKVEETFNARFTVALSASTNTIEKGATTSVTFTFTPKWDGSAVEATSVTAKLNDGTSVTMTKQSNNSYTAAVSLKDSKTLTVTAVYNGVSKSASYGVNAYYKFYYGKSTLATLTGKPSDFTAQGPKSSAAGTYAFTFTAGQYAYFLLPAGVSRGKLTSAGSDGYYHASEGVSDVPFAKQSTAISINGVSYDVFRLASPQAASSHNITI